MTKRTGCRTCFIPGRKLAFYFSKTRAMASRYGQCGKYLCASMCSRELTLNDLFLVVNSIYGHVVVFGLINGVRASALCLTTYV